MNCTCTYDMSDHYSSFHIRNKNCTGLIEDNLRCFGYEIILCEAVTFAQPSHHEYICLTLTTIFPLFPNSNILVLKFSQVLAVSP